MSTKIFTDEEIEILNKNLYVKKVTPKGITYTTEFKQICIDEHIKGTLPKDIFRKYGFDIDIIGFWRIHAADKRWRKSYNLQGISGLMDARKHNIRRPIEKELSIEEKYERLKIQNQILKAELDLIKKIEKEERRLIKSK